jgi:hypothetical protein
MQTKHRITRVEISDPKNTRVYLEDGSELAGVISVDTNSSVNDISKVTLSAYVFPNNGVVYEHFKTKERVTLNPAGYCRFFDNRNPAEWRRVFVPTK